MKERRYSSGLRASGAGRRPNYECIGAAALLFFIQFVWLAQFLTNKSTHEVVRGLPFLAGGDYRELHSVREPSHPARLRSTHKSSYKELQSKDRMAVAKVQKGHVRQDSGAHHTSARLGGDSDAELAVARKLGEVTTVPGKVPDLPAHIVDPTMVQTESQAFYRKFAGQAHREHGTLSRNGRRETAILRNRREGGEMLPGSNRKGAGGSELVGVHGGGSAEVGRGSVEGREMGRRAAENEGTRVGHEDKWRGNSEEGVESAGEDALKLTVTDQTRRDKDVDSRGDEEGMERESKVDGSLSRNKERVQGKAGTEMLVKYHGQGDRSVGGAERSVGVDLGRSQQVVKPGLPVPSGSTQSQGHSSEGSLFSRSSNVDLVRRSGQGETSGKVAKSRDAHLGGEVGVQTHGTASRFKEGEQEGEGQVIAEDAVGATDARHSTRERRAEVAGGASGGKEEILQETGDSESNEVEAFEWPKKRQGQTGPLLHPGLIQEGATPLRLPSNYARLFSRLRFKRRVMTQERLRQRGSISCGGSGAVGFRSWENIADNVFRGQDALFPENEPWLPQVSSAVQSPQCKRERDEGRACKILEALSKGTSPMPEGDDRPTCAVVGNSGKLRRATHGPEIDSADIVIRFNSGKTRGFERQVGTKSHIRIYNGPYVESKQDGEITIAQIRDPAIREWVRQRRKHNATAAYIFDPEFLCHAWDWVGHEGMKPSSGLVGVVFALSICRSVDVYGFQYYDYFDARARPHYYDWERPKPGRERVHPFRKEKHVYSILAQSGKLILH